MSTTRFDEDIWFLERVSQGLSFELFLAFWPEENDKVLVKKVREDLDPQRKAEAEERLLKEASTLEEFWSPYFPKVYDIRTKEDDGSLYLIVQYFSGISLREYIHLHMEKRTVSAHFIENFIHEMDHALNYLHHKKGIVHLDISPDNIIITQDNKVKVIDFEDSRQTGTQLDTSKLRGKENYLSPELMKAVQNDKKESFEPRWDNYAYAKTIEELCAQTKGMEKYKTLRFKKKIKNLKGAKTLPFKVPFTMPKFNLSLPSFNGKYLTSAFVTLLILGFTLLSLELIGRAHIKSKHNKKRQASYSRERQRTLRPTTTVRKINHQKTVKKVRKKAKPKKVVRYKKKIQRRPSLPRTPKRKVTRKKSPTINTNQDFIEAKAQVIKRETVNQTDLYKKEIEKLISKKEPYLKECMSYESSNIKGDLQLSFYLRSHKGRAKRISFDNAPNLNQLTKSCLEALYADIIFPAPPTNKELKFTQHFTFAKNLSQNKGDLEVDSIIL